MATTAHNGRIAITATGTAEALASAQEVGWLMVWTPRSNQNAIKLGKSTVTDTDATTEGLPIIPGAPPIILPACDLADIYVVGFATDKIYYVADSGTSTSGTTVVQATAANFNATVVQATATNLHVEAEQGTASELNATVVPAGWTPSAELAVGTNVVKASAGILHGFLVETDGTNDVTVQFYNHTSTSTTPITPSIVVAGGDNYGGAMNMDITCSVGIVCIHSGSGGIVTAYFA